MQPRSSISLWSSGRTLRWVMNVTTPSDENILNWWKRATGLILVILKTFRLHSTIAEEEAPWMRVVLQSWRRTLGWKVKCPPDQESKSSFPHSTFSNWRWPGWHYDLVPFCKSSSTTIATLSIGFNLEFKRSFTNKTFKFRWLDSE